MISFVKIFGCIINCYTLIISMARTFWLHPCYIPTGAMLSSFLPGDDDSPAQTVVSYITFENLIERASFIYFSPERPVGWKILKYRGIH